VYVPLLILIVRIDPGLMPFSVKIQSLVLWPPPSNWNALPSSFRNELICNGSEMPLA